VNFESFLKRFTEGIKPLTNFDILNICEKLKIKNFKGVFMRDELSKTKFNSKSFCLALNLDSSSNEGTHWTCLYLDKNTSCYYFDSYGFPPPLEVLEYCKNIQFRYYNSFQIQKFDDSGSPPCGNNPLNDVGCGHFSIYVLYKLSEGFSFYNILSELVRYNK